MENYPIYSVDSTVQPLIKKKPRNASFELLRIISMLFIISVHFYGFGGWQNVEGAINGFFMNLTRALFSPSVNIFVLISAYFMCARDDMRIPWKKLIAIWLPVYFYSIVLYTVFTATGVYTFDVQSLLQTLFPILLGKYWFVSAYFIMTIASPMLNAIIKHLNKAQFSALCIAIIVFAALQDIEVLTSSFPLSYGYNGIWFCLLYFIAAYIRKYDISLNTIAWLIGLVGFIALTLITAFFWHWPNYTSIIPIYMTLFVFLTAKKFTVSNPLASKMICGISKLTFGIYLIHMSPELCGYMYENIFHSSQFIGSKYAYLIYIGFVSATFVACAIIEWIRQLCFKGANAIAHRLFGDKLESLKTSCTGFISRIIRSINEDDNATPAANYPE